MFLSGLFKRKRPIAFAIGQKDSSMYFMNNKN